MSNTNVNDCGFRHGQVVDGVVVVRPLVLEWLGVCGPQEQSFAKILGSSLHWTSIFSWASFWNQLKWVLFKQACCCSSKTGLLVFIRPISRELSRFQCNNDVGVFSLLWLLSVRTVLGGNLPVSVIASTLVSAF